MKDIVLPIIIGLFFGLALQKAGLTHYDKVVNQFRFTDNTMLKFMLSAIVVGLIGVTFLKDIGVITANLIPSTYVVGNLVGGLIFGVGMAVAGTCPGTVVAGIGQGNLDYLIPGVLGFLTGAFLFGISYEPIFVPFRKIMNYGQKTLETVFHINRWIWIALFVIGVSAFYVISKRMAKAAVQKSAAAGVAEEIAEIGEIEENA